MKRYCKAVLQSVIKGLHGLMKRERPGKRLHTALTSARPGKRSRCDVKLASESRAARHKNPVWKNRTAVIAAGAAAIVLAVMLVLALPFSTVQAQAHLRAALLPAQQGTAILSMRAPSAEALPSASPSPSPVPEAGAEPVLNSPADDTPTETPEESPVPTTAPEPQVLMPGGEDPRIAEVQLRLMELGYMEKDEPTTYYGYGTEYALQLFQRKHALQVDGLLGEKTMAALFSDEAQPYTVKLGDRGTDVKSIQEQLIELKYLKSGSTGYFGTDTEAAVKIFQQRNGLAVDGCVGSQTLEALYSNDAKPAKTVSDSTKKAAKTTDNKDSKTGSRTNSSTDAKTDQNDNKPDTKAEEKLPPPPPDTASADALVEYAKNFLGTKYVRGGKSPEGFDCSGFVYYCLNQVGYKIKYMTSAGWAKSNLPEVTSMSDLKKGDIICFKGHVGIYMGDGNMIDASSSFGGIRIAKNIFSSSYWKKTFICGRCVF
jgi:peptidoglycan hydrolase-like protein with peptidoglycan-binding domain